MVDQQEGQVGQPQGLDGEEGNGETEKRRLRYLHVVLWVIGHGSLAMGHWPWVIGHGSLEPNK